MGNEIEGELLERNRTAIAEPAMNRDRASGNHHNGGEVESVKCNPGNQTAPLHEIQGKSEDVGSITKFALKLEMNPTENQRESNQRRNDTAPHDQKVHSPT